jgi:LPXTG-motif cell wall-anchored protein
VTIIAVLIFGQVLMASVGPSYVAAASVSAAGANAPEMQTTATSTTSPGTLPETGATAADSSGLLLGAVALIVAGSATVLLLANRRERRS